MRLVTLMIGLAATSAHAADIAVKSGGSDMPIITLSGEITSQDGDQFRQKVASLTRATVVFHSPGGSIAGGIVIGETIRAKGFVTFVPTNAQCASACALAWLGGARRLMASDARIGFHAAYDGATGQETGVGNAIVGAYLTKLGLPYRAVIYITKAPPRSMTWLNPAEADQQGINVSVFSSLPTTHNSPLQAAQTSVQPRAPLVAMHNDPPPPCQ